jgi:plasmid stabilization system protein ParE
MRELVLTQTAKEDLEQIASFLQETFSQKTKIDFLTAFSERLHLIEKMPFMYQASYSNPNVRRCLIHKNVVCYYQVTDDHILILAVIDTRMNPDNRPF